MKLNSFSFAFELECSFCMFLKFCVDLVFLWRLCIYTECVYSFGKYTVHIPYLTFNLENYEKSFELRPERTNDLFEWQIESNNESLNKRELTAVNQKPTASVFLEEFSHFVFVFGRNLDYRWVARFAHFQSPGGSEIQWNWWPNRFKMPERELFII